MSNFKEDKYLQQSVDSCGNCFEGKSDLDHVCRKCGGRDTAACNLDKPPSHVDNAPFGFSPNEASAWSTGYEQGYENACEDFYRKGISNAS